MKIIILISIIIFILFLFKVFSGRNNIKTKKDNQNETTIDLEKDPITKEYKPKE